MSLLNSFIETFTKPHHINMYIVYTGFILIVIAVSIINSLVVKKYGHEYTKSLIQFPFVFLSSLFIFIAIGKTILLYTRNAERYDNSLGIELAKFTQQIVVDRWENDFSKNKNLGKLYQSVFSKPSNSINKKGFYTKSQWEKKFPHIPYVPYEGNEDSWHFAAQFIQEQLNIYRMFHLDQKFKLGNNKDLTKSQQGLFAGWMTCFRMFYSNPIIRNVWEQYKYRHSSPYYSAWVKYYIIDIIEKPNFFKEHVQSWDKQAVDLLNRYKKKFKKVNSDNKHKPINDVNTMFYKKY